MARSPTTDHRYSKRGYGAQIPAEKSYFGFAAGLNTDASPINFPDESTQDEENFELLRDGSRRRRKGLDLEVGGSIYTLPNTLGTSDKVTSYKWRNAGGTGSNFIVVQTGSDLSFFADQTLPSTSVDGQTIDLLQYKVTGKADTDVSQNVVSMTSGRNRLIVCGRYIEPFYIEWNGTDFSTRQITIFERDFVGIDDGVGNTTLPAALSDEHNYNLLNRGWKGANIASYYTGSSSTAYPSKNMYPWKGYRRAVVTNKAEEDGNWEWSYDKITSELFGDSTAPQGHLVVNPFDTTTSGTGTALSIDAISTDWSSSGSTVTLTITSHGLTGTKEFYITGNAFVYYTILSIELWGSLNGTHTATYVDANTYTISVAAPYYYDSGESFDPFGEVAVTDDDLDIVTNPAPFTTSERPQQVAWYAGRVFFFGIDDPKLSDRIYFSRIVEDEKDYGKCYQRSDPTDNQFNELRGDDGGVIVVPDFGKVYGSGQYGSSLLMFTENGVWEFSGGNTVFSATAYVVRKVSELPATSSYGVLKAGETIYWTGPEGIHRIAQDSQSGFLTSDTITLNRVQKLWNGIQETEQRRIKLAYDHSQQRLYILYNSTSGGNANEYDYALVFDALIGSFYKLVFPLEAANYITHVLSISTNEDGENNKNIKFLVQASTRTTLKFCDMDQTDFVDFNGGEQIPTMVTGYDNLQDFQRFKQAPVLHFYAQKTETGYTLVGTDLVPINESSILITPVWDWSDHENSKKFGTQQQIYRHKRYYQPVDANDGYDDGYPVVVTRTKLRGRGRVLHIKIDGEEGKDAHILGWAIHYKGSRLI